MAVKRYNGSSWDVVAGLGAQGPAATSSSIATWVKTASGGETSLSGNDDNSQSLSYTVGQELVFINGTLLKRGSDYTATNGTSITGLTALAANDVATVWTVNAFSVTNAISNTIVDAKGDLIVATGADTPGILTAGTTGQVLTVDSTTGTGLKWAAPAAAGYVGVSVYKSANQSIDPSADVVVTWNTEDFDTDSFHSNTTNTGRFTIPSGKGGKYLLTGTLNWEAGAGTYREVKIYKNGSILTRMVMFAGTNDGCNQSFACVYDLVATDYLEIAARHSNGGSFNVLGGSGYSRAQLTYLGA